MTRPLPWNPLSTTWTDGRGVDTELPFEVGAPVNRSAGMAPRCSALGAECPAGPDLDTLAEESVCKEIASD